MSNRWLRLLLVMLFTPAMAAECGAIEMFTFFGDGSRIGLPNLEVPIEAYPGIPLRSDRLRARRRGMRSMPAPQQGQPGMPPGVTIRAMPPEQMAPMPPAARAPEVRSSTPRRGSIPVAPLPPEPETLLQPQQGRVPVPGTRSQTSAQPASRSDRTVNKTEPPLVDPR